MIYLGLVLTAVVALAVGGFLMLQALLFFTALVETRLIRTLVPAPADDPEHARFSPPEERNGAGSGDHFNPYASPGSLDDATGQNLAAAALGFRIGGLHVHAKGGTYRVHTALWIAPDRRTLAANVWGTLARIGVGKTILYSRTDDGKILVTSDKLTGDDTPGLYETAVLQGASFEELLARHERRLGGPGRAAVPFDGDDALAHFTAIVAARHRFLVGRRDEYFIDPEETAVRSTLKGACKACARAWRVPDYVEQISEPGADPVPVGRHADRPPSRLNRLSWFFLFLTVVAVPVSSATVLIPGGPALQAGLFYVAIFGFAATGLAQVVVRLRTPRR